MLEKNEQIDNAQVDNEQTDNAQADNVEKKKTSKKTKILVTAIFAVLFIVVAAVVFFYWRTAVYYQTHFLPNTRINGVVCDELEVQQVVSMLETGVDEYCLQVYGRVDENGENGIIGEIAARDIGLRYVGIKESVEAQLAAQNEWRWGHARVGKLQVSATLVQGVDFDREMLGAYVQEWNAFQNMMEPKDAYISDYSEEKGYEIVPETAGTQIDTDIALEWIIGAVEMQSTGINLEDYDCYMAPEITSHNEILRKNVEELNRWLQTEIVYDWNGREVLLNKEIILPWITIVGITPKLDKEAIEEFVNANANEYDTYGKNRRFLTTLGVELTLPSGAYGWRTDREAEVAELEQLIYQGTNGKREPLYLKKGRWKGINDIGNSYVEADLTNQHLYLYWQGNLVLEADFVSGNPNWEGCFTPQGVFGLTYKTTNAVLRGANYETPVSYWMPYHGNFGMHDATWRSEFGGDIYLTDGSHGCLNLPLDKAEAIYGYMSEGFPIICYYY